MTGSTGSSDFPIAPGAFQTTFGAYTDAFVTKLNGTGTALVYSTYIGGVGVTQGYGIAIDASGAAYITGSTNGNFPTTPGALQTTFGGSFDAFVTKMNADGSAQVYSAYLGGSQNDAGYAIAEDSNGAAYITGYTQASNFPITSACALQRTFGGVQDVCVTKLNAAGSAWLTLLSLRATPLTTVKASRRTAPAPHI